MSFQAPTSTQQEQEQERDQLLQQQQMQQQHQQPAVQMQQLGVPAQGYGHGFLVANGPSTSNNSNNNSHRYSMWADSEASEASFGGPRFLPPRLAAIPPPTTPFAYTYAASASASTNTGATAYTASTDAGLVGSGGAVDGAGGGIAGGVTTTTPSTTTHSYANDSGARTNLGNTRVVMALLSELWIVNLAFILGGTYLKSFFLGNLQQYEDYYLWNSSCYWKLGLLLPLPYTLICFFGLVLPFRTPKFLDYSQDKKRRVDNLYILTVTKGDNRDAVYRAWDAHKHLERLHPSVRVHVLTDEPYFFEGINCYTCPTSFSTSSSKYKARALEWYRQTMRFSEYDWILHLDEESVIDDESVKRILDFIFYEKEFHFGQGVIFYNQYKYWNNWIFTVADALRVGDDVSRFQLQYTYFHRPVFGAHGSFLLTNGLVENAVTWDLGSLTEDYQFAVKAWDRGFRCGKIAGIVREQSPLDLIGFMKQRRRWYVGIRRLPSVLPKVWSFFWSLGIISLFASIASIALGFELHYGTPRWMAMLIDFNFMTFVYLYILGIFLQDLDKKVNPLLMLVRIPTTIVIQFIAVIMEGLAVMYGIAFPPADFDVIKK
ncbi:hypothetical protein HK100_000023 [Physocladia obscura]|uniref:Glycosyltransferase 2-like domain-containing protein n=1 Tax=Physocladia obscura TaxID=109957 RepID=A0AAD5XIQ0_9FUNG|nr:hypothetical protein HK100_000023 [Physocladia obscura]